jgi:hypothetical protein
MIGKGWHRSCDACDMCHGHMIVHKWCENVKIREQRAMGLINGNHYSQYTGQDGCTGYQRLLEVNGLPKEAR